MLPLIALQPYLPDYFDGGDTGIFMVGGGYSAYVSAPGFSASVWESTYGYGNDVVSYNGGSASPLGMSKMPDSSMPMGGSVTAGTPSGFASGTLGLSPIGIGEPGFNNYGSVDVNAWLPVVRGVKGSPNRVPVLRDIHKAMHKGAGGRLWNDSFIKAIEKRGGFENVSVETILKIRDTLKWWLG